MLLIKELLPNPTGSDEEGEWIRLINDGTDQVDASNLYLADESGKSYSLSSVGIVGPRETIELQRLTTKIALNNNGDTIFLRDVGGETRDELSYGVVKEGEIITATKFLPKPPAREETASILDSGFSGIDYTPTIAPVLVGIVAAAIAACLTWFVAERLFQKDDEDLY